MVCWAKEGSGRSDVVSLVKVFIFSHCVRPIGLKRDTPWSVSPRVDVGLSVDEISVEIEGNDAPTTPSSLQTRDEGIAICEPWPIHTHPRFASQRLEPLCS